MNIGLSMRKYHRWISTAGMVLIFYLALTGTVLAIFQISDPASTRPIAELYPELGAPGMNAPGMAGVPMNTMDTTPLPDAAQLETMATTVLRAARASASPTTLDAVRIRLRTQADQVQGIVTLNRTGQPPQTLAFDARTGAAIDLPADVMPQPMGMPPGGMMGSGMGGAGGMEAGGGPGGSVPFSALLQQIHSGAIVGMSGQWVILVTGVALIFLSFTGIWMFFDMMNRRRKNGRTDWFWT